MNLDVPTENAYSFLIFNLILEFEIKNRKPKILNNEMTSHLKVFRNFLRV